MKKLDLILLPGFQTNTVILRELLEYLNSFFNIYFIDFPGFNTNIRPFDHISIENFVSYSERQIEELNLRSYILGGISFGYNILSRMNLKNQCKGILAIEPYLGVNSLGISKKRYFLFSTISKIVNDLKLYNYAFQLVRNKTIERLLTNGKEHLVDRITTTTDPRTYFQTLQIILSIKDYGTIKSYLPHLILMNPEDKTLNYNRIIELINKKVPNVKVLNMKLEHFPTNISTAYLKKKLPKKIFTEITSFFMV